MAAHWCILDVTCLWTAKCCKRFGRYLVACQADDGCNQNSLGQNVDCFLQVSVLEMDGQFDKLEELIYIESHLSNTSAKFYGEITQQMLKNSHFPGSQNGTGLFQTICGLKLREVYEALIQQEVKPVV